MNYNQYDVLRAFQNSILPHKKMKFKIPGFSYPENGGFPSIALPETQYALFDMVMLDNAKSHLSKNVRDKALNTINCTLNYGSVATPETRGIKQEQFKKENPTPIINKEVINKQNRSLPSAEVVQNMSAEEMWKYIKGAK